MSEGPADKLPVVWRHPFANQRPILAPSTISLFSSTNANLFDRFNVDLELCIYAKLWTIFLLMSETSRITTSFGHRQEADKEIGIFAAVVCLVVNRTGDDVERGMVKSNVFLETLYEKEDPRQYGTPPYPRPETNYKQGF